MPFNLGAFAGGVGQGIEQGQSIQEKYRKMAEEQVARRAQQAVDNWLNPPAQPNPAPGGGAPPATPGVSPTPIPAAPPQQAAIPGAQPLPPGAPGATPAMPPGPGGAPPAMPPGGAGPPGANAPAPPPPQAPMPAAPPPGPQGPPPGGAPPGGAGGLPPPGSPQTQDPVAQGKAAIQAVAKEIAAANPGRKWQKGELLDAVTDAVGLMKQLDPTAAKAAQLQIELARLSIQQQEQDLNRGERGREADQRAGVQSAALVEKIRRDRSVEAIEKGRAQTYAEMASLGHEDRQAAIQERRDQATQAVDSREKVAAQKDADTMARLDKALDDKDWATVAQIQAGEYKADAAANPNPSKPVPKPAVTPPPRRTAGATSGGGAPVAGARKAPDGKWYVQDPKRPGKYLMVQ